VQFGIQNYKYVEPIKLEIMTRTKKILLYSWCACVALAAVVVVAFITWRINLSREVDAKLTALRAAGMPASGAELNDYYPAVPANQNAAPVMAQAFALMRNFPDSRSNEVANFTIPARGHPWTAAREKLLSDYVAMNAAALGRMRAAIKLPDCRYPVDYTPGPGTLLLHLQKLHNLAEIVRYESLLAGESGDTANAAVAIENLLGMAHTLDKEPDLIAQLVRISFTAMAKESLERCLNITNLNRAELSELAPGFSAADKTNVMVRALIGERAINTPVFIEASQTPEAAKGLVEGAQTVGGFADPMLDFWLIHLPRFFEVTGFWDRDLLFYLNNMETNIALDHFAPPRSLAAADNFKKAEKEVEQNHYYLSKLFLEALSSAVVKEAKNLAYLRVSIAAVAVERFRVAHGQLPQSLNDLVPQFLSAVPADPFDGKPLRYHRLAKGYVIYSVGADGQDDGGREKPADWKSGDKTNYDITFTVER
jgi:hypothetical protein